MILHHKIASGTVNRLSGQPEKSLSAGSSNPRRGVENRGKIKWKKHDLYAFVVLTFQIGFNALQGIR